MGEEDEAARDAIGETPEPPPGPDHFLRFLVTIVDKADVEVGVTLNVGGLLVSGLLVGYDKYAEGVVSQLKEAGGSKEANAFLEEAIKDPAPRGGVFQNSASWRCSCSFL
jgi:hypothetical protein